MSFRKRMQRAAGISEKLIPNSYQLVGDVMLLKLPKMKGTQKTKLAEAVLKEFPYVKTVCELAGIAGEFREPRVTRLAGNGTETVHKENVILYKLDVAQLMFSKGNLNERKRLVEKVKQGETVVDMFAGIGYFSLGLAKFSKAKNIIAIEKSSKAYNALVENIALNKITNISAMLGDSRIAAKGLPGIADRIVMGYLPKTEQFLPAAIFMLKRRGTIHFHNTYRRKELWQKPMTDLEAVCKGMNCSFHTETKKKVKSYAPNVWHVVMDIGIEKL